ncbi:hypothetical protein TTHERM_00673450 (macronuclear) [Tetrahymena thermophila SB210]|uniref:Uncharacterized protein n=1 Tax=Tetrahymena thermophila (strain SB210) TaxID=312017 RepID=Q23E17_TETTS|nr:hypothetical protein TTHERM_00673450 [Tetrahymena thermophila SB210]EAR94770.1 hypothetical protein TTHERM_00673450 [Tetrahymena thermophila SB210]|eukprot:XP_001015015.1 hypothetical protein TTHERM_00673450 [Tetrahymena thermophila SB210]
MSGLSFKINEKLKSLKNSSFSKFGLQKQITKLDFGEINITQKESVIKIF